MGVVLMQGIYYVASVLGYAIYACVDHFERQQKTTVVHSDSKSANMRLNEKVARNRLKEKKDTKVCSNEKILE
jgi:hypothetical protein